MPEGHTVHRSANQFNRAFRSRGLTVDSPQGRFAQSAELVSGAKLKLATAVGKQLFLNFDNGYMVRIHLGIYGKWRWYQLDEQDELPTVRGEIRARFYGLDGKGKMRLAELRGPTACEVLTQDEVQQVLKRLGSDPLNPDPDEQEYLRFESKVLKSSKSIGLLLMDQSVISGIGNVYRAELLFRAQLNPHQRGKDLLASQVRELWDDSVRLLEVGVKKGVMITRDEHLAKDPGKQHRNFVYKREGKPCRVCGNDISIELAAGRKLYWCTVCQS